jgi:hypothetical protein
MRGRLVLPHARSSSRQAVWQERGTHTFVGL